MIISMGVKSPPAATDAPGAGAAGVQPAGLYPAGGTIMSWAPRTTATRKIIPRYMKVAIMPDEAMKTFAMGVKTRAPAPKPATASPVIIPRLSGNHFTQVAIGQT